MSPTNDAGTALLLLPATFVVVLVLAAIATDMGVVRLTHSEAVDAASAAADAAVTQGVDVDRLRSGEGWHLDEGAARAAVQRTLAHHDVHRRIESVDVRRGPAPSQLTVTVRARADYVFARGLPGPDSTTVTARATATALQR